MFKDKNFIFLKYILFITFGVMIFGFSHLSHAKKYQKDLSLTVGVYKDVKIKRAPNSFAKGGTYKKIVNLKYNPRDKILRFVPKRVGVATLFIKNPRNGKVIYEFRLDVKKTNLYKVSREIKRLLKNIEGISIKVINNKVIVDGQILLPKDMNRIHSVVKQYDGMASSLVTLSPVAQVKIAQFIERAIGNPEVHVKSINGKFILEGVVSTVDEKKRSYTIAQTYVPDDIVDEAVADKKVRRMESDVVINLIKIRPQRDTASIPKKTIQVVVHYVELQKDYSKSFRFQWTPDLGDGSSVEFSTGGRSSGGVVSTLTGTIRNLLPKLNWAKEHGHARILQSSSIIVEDRGKGVLNSLQRIPYQVVTAQGLPSTNFEEAGIRTTVTPGIIGERSDSIKLNLSFSVKSLLGINASGPLTSSKEISTTLVVRSGSSAAVGGLITNDNSTGYNRLPANTSNNPLFSLYASKDFRRNQSQFVVFVTPIIKSSASAGSEKIKRKFRLRD